MSDSDSFIEEVTEEVRRDRLFALMRRYGWIAVLAVLVLVGGAAWNEWRKASARAEAEALGDAVLGALENDAPDARIAALQDISAASAGGQAVLGLLVAAEYGAQADERADPQAAAKALEAVAIDGELPPIYRDIAAYKRLVRLSEILPASERRAGFEALAAPGGALRLLAEEQLALIDVEEGARDAALERLNLLVQDSEVTAGLRLRATQLIVALGGTPETGAAPEG